MKSRKMIIWSLAVLIVLAATVTGLSLFGALNWFKPMLVERLGKRLGRPVAVNGDLEWVWTLPPGLAANDAAVANAAWAEAPRMAELARIEITPRWSSLLQGRFAVDDITVQGADLNLARNADGEWNLPRPDAGGDNRSGPAVPRLPTFHLRDSRLQIRTPEQDHTIQIEALTLSLGTPDAPSRGRARLHWDERPLAVEASASPTRALFEQDTAVTLNTKLQSGGNTLSLEGTLAAWQRPPRLDLRVDLDLPQPANLPLRLSLPAVEKQGLALRGHLRNASAEGRYRLADLQVTAGADKVTGWVEFAPFGDPLQVEAELTSPHADLRPYWAAAASSAAASGEADDATPSASESKRVFSNEPFDLPALSGIRLTARTSVETLLLPRLALKNLDATVNIEDGRLDLEPLSAAVGDGTVTARLQVVSSQPLEIKTRGKIERLDLAEMLQTLDLPPSLQGDLGLQFDLQGRGASPAELAGSLDGRFSLAMQGGRIARRYLKKAEAYDFELTDAFVRLLKPKQKEASEFVNLDCAVARFHIEDGVARSNVLVFDTARAGVVGDGRIDLGDERLNIALKPITGGGIGIPGLVKLKVGTTVADAFKLGGTLKAPKVSVDKSESALTLGKAVGGLLLFGPAGLTAGLLEADFGADNPCVKALQQAGMIESPDER
jgi:uncharacterized protein involved in outer membrane biogenesis